MNPVQHFDIRLTPQELDIVANALTNQPWGQVNALLLNIKAQVEYQQKAAMEPVMGIPPSPSDAELSLQPQQINGHAQ